MANAVSVRQRLIGSCLRRYRESLGYDLGVAARILECDPSKISRIETGQRGIRPKELRELLTEYGVGPAAQDTLAAIARPGEDASWWREHAPVLAAGQLEHLAAESAASAIMAYAPVQIPELLHTPDYARAVASADLNVPEDAEDATVAAVLARQRAMLEERRAGLTVVIGETALRQNIGGAEVLRAQLRHLADLAAGCPQATIHILPFGAGAHAAGSSGAFSVLKFSQVPDLGLVHVAGPSGGICLDTPPAVDAYARAFTHLRLSALTPQDSARKLRQMSRAQPADQTPPVNTGPTWALKSLPVHRRSANDIERGRRQFGTYPDLIAVYATRSGARAEAWRALFDGIPMGGADRQRAPTRGISGSSGAPTRGEVQPEAQAQEAGSANPASLK